MTDEQMKELKRHIDVKIQLVLDNLRDDDRFKALVKQALKEGTG